MYEDENTYESQNPAMKFLAWIKSLLFEPEQKTEQPIIITVRRLFPRAELSELTFHNN